MKTTHTQTYNIRVTDPAPSLSQSVTVHRGLTYAEAVAATHDAWRAARRPVVLCSGEFGNYFWHRVDSKGVATDRNTNSGVPELQQLA